MQRGYRIYI